jgi:hypothetical protein
MSIRQAATCGLIARFTVGTPRGPIGKIAILSVITSILVPFNKGNDASLTALFRQLQQNPSILAGIAVFFYVFPSRQSFVRSLRRGAAFFGARRAAVPA